jgi:hypothetical protein
MDSMSESEAFRLFLQILSESPQVPNPLRDDINAIRIALEQIDQKETESLLKIRQHLETMRKR